MLRLRGTVVAWTLATLLGLGAPVASAQDTVDPMTTPDWGDYPLLMSQFGELCTMCEAYVQCRPHQTSGATSDQFTLYYFKTKTFWGQIATIWDYFALWFDPVTSESRPAAVFRFGADAGRQFMTPVEAYLSAVDAKIKIDETWIDRDALSWHDKDGTEIGTCRRLGIPESMAMIERAEERRVSQQESSP